MGNAFLKGKETSLKGTVKLLEKVRFEAGAESGHTATIDGPQEAGGENAGFRPMELMLLGLGSCMAFDVLLILRKMRQEVTSYTLNLEGERAEDPPRVYTDVRMEHVFKGLNLKPESIQRAIELAETIYCSASAMFAKTARVKNTFRILES
jgi:putative redox protein